MPAPWAPVELAELLAGLGADPSAQANRTYLLEPVVATQTLLGWALLIAALASLSRSSTPDTNSRERVQVFPRRGAQVYGN